MKNNLKKGMILNGRTKICCCHLKTLWIHRVFDHRAQKLYEFLWYGFWAWWSNDYEFIWFWGCEICSSYEMLLRFFSVQCRYYLCVSFTVIFLLGSADLGKKSFTACGLSLCNVWGPQHYKSRCEVPVKL